MAALPPDIDDDVEESPDEGAPARAAPVSAPIFSDTSLATPSLPDQTERHFYGTLKDTQPDITQGITQPGNPPPGIAPESNVASVDLQAAAPKPARHIWNKLIHRSHAPINEKLAVTLAPSEALNDWQKTLYAHARLNGLGQPVDETGKHVINIKDMNSEFGQRLAQTCLDLDATGHRGQFYISSGKRTEAEEDVIRAHYASIGSDHPVGRPGWSPHAYGVATDLQYTGHDRNAFYADFHAQGKKNGLGFVADDPNHCQIPNAHQYVAEMRSKQATETASNTPHPQRAPAPRASNPMA